MTDESKYITKYLIGLGYSVDKLQQATFNNAASDAGKTVSNAIKLGTVAVAGLTGMLIKSVKGMDDLYQSATLANAGMLEFRATADAFAQIGGSADEMASTLENIGIAARNNPGAVVFKQIVDGATDATVVLRRFLEYYQKQRDLAKEQAGAGFNEAIFRSTFFQYADQMGMSQSVMDRILQQPDVYLGAIGQRMQSMRDKGLNEQNMRDSAAAVREAKLAFDGLEDAMWTAASQTLPLLNEKLEEFNNWFKNNPDKAKEKIDQLGKAFQGVTTIVSGLATAVEKLSEHPILGGALAGAVLTKGPLQARAAGGLIGALLGAYLSRSDVDANGQPVSPHMGFSKDDVKRMMGVAPPNYVEQVPTRPQAPTPATPAGIPGVSAPVLSNPAVDAATHAFKNITSTFPMKQVAGGTTVNQNVTIRIDSTTGDPKAIAAAVRAEMDAVSRSNARIYSALPSN